MGKHPKRRDRSTPNSVAATPASPAVSPGGKGVSAPAPWARGENLKIFWASLLLGVVALLAYANSFSAKLVLDNGTIIGEDPRLRTTASENVEAIFTHNYWWPAFESNLYRPLTTLSYWVNYSVLDNGQRVEQLRAQAAAQNKPFDYSTLDNGAHLWGYHIVNFLLHWANIILVLVIVRRLSGQLGLAVLAAAIFAVHPINVEAVTNIVGRADLFATFFILFGSWCYMKAGETKSELRLLWLLLVGGCAFIGGFAKESAVIIFPFIVLYDAIWRWPRLPGPTLLDRFIQAITQFFLKGWLPVLVGILLFLLCYSLFWMQAHTPIFGEIFADNPISGSRTWFQGRMTAIKVLGHYLALLVFPKTLSSEYSYNQIPLYGQGNDWEDAQCWLALGVILALLGTAVWLRRRQPLLAWGIFLFFLSQILTCNLLFPIGTIMAERSQYLPSMGYAVVIAQILWWIGGALARLNLKMLTQPLAAGALAALFIAALGARTFVRNVDWQDTKSLWTSAYHTAPNSFKAYKGYADALWREVLNKQSGDPIAEEQALDHTITLAEQGLHILDVPALDISKQDNTLYQDLGLYYRLKGDYLAKRGKPDEARQAYLKSLAVLYRARDVDHWVNQTSRETQLKRGRDPKDIPDVGNYRIYILISLTCQKLGDWKNAEASGRYVVRLVPTEPIGYRLVAMAYDQEGHTPEAVVEILQGLLLKMDDGGCWNDLIGYYKKMDLKPFPLTPLPDKGTYMIDQKNPMVREELNQACVQLIRRIEEAKLFDDARNLEQTLIKNIQVPADLFNK